jgi:2-polyprenyl-6-methoxyphenol hydroxylase-like FAD-dependent oxidoreductase
MDHIGIYDRLRTSGYNYGELAFTNGAGHVLGKFLNGSQKEYNFPALRIHRTTVRQELIREVERQGIEIYWNKKCVGMKEEHENGATVHFEDGEAVAAEFVIGTDGIHSHIRPFIAPHSDPQFSGLIGVMGTVMAENLQSLTAEHGLQLPSMLFRANDSFAIMPASFDGKEVGYFAMIEAEDRGREGWAKLEGDKDELKKMLDDRFLDVKASWPPLVKELCQKTPLTLTSWPFFSIPHLDT